MNEQSYPHKWLNNKRVALIGFGDINHRVAKLLESSGAKIFAYRRNIDKIDLPFVEKNVLDVSEPIAELPDVDYVIMTLSPHARSEEAYRKCYVDGLANVLAALNTDRLKQFFWVSSSSVYGQDDDGWVDELSSTKPSKTTGKILLEAENLLTVLGDKACTVRFTGIYREHRHRLVDKIKANELSAVVEKDYYTNRIHVEDCARALVHLLGLSERGEVVDRLYVASDDDPVQYLEMIQWISEQTGLPLNKGLSAIKKTVGSKKVSNAKLKATGFELKYPSFRRGFTEIIERSNC